MNCRRLSLVIGLTALVSLAQVRMLSEGLVEALPPCEPVPADLAPRIEFSEAQIRKGLPEPGAFGLADCRCLGRIGLCGVGAAS